MFEQALYTGSIEKGVLRMVLEPEVHSLELGRLQIDGMNLLDAPAVLSSGEHQKTLNGLIRAAVSFPKTTNRLFTSAALVQLPDHWESHLEAVKHLGFAFTKSPARLFVAKIAGRLYFTGFKLATFHVFRETVGNLGVVEVKEDWVRSAVLSHVPQAHITAKVRAQFLHDPQ